MWTGDLLDSQIRVRECGILSTQNTYYLGKPERWFLPGFIKSNHKEENLALQWEERGWNLSYQVKRRAQAWTNLERPVKRKGSDVTSIDRYTELHTRKMSSVLLYNQGPEAGWAERGTRHRHKKMKSVLMTFPFDSGCGMAGHSNVKLILYFKLWYFAHHGFLHSFLFLKCWIIYYLRLITEF